MIRPVSCLQARRAERDYVGLRLYEEMFDPEQPPDAATSRRLRLTAEGLHYYGAWWKRFGFVMTFDGECCVDGETFFDIWQFIHRADSGLPDTGIFTPDDLATMSSGQRALGETLNHIVMTGEPDTDLSGKVQAARTERESRRNVVVVLAKEERPG